MILHGGSDPLVPHNQGEQLYMAFNKACLDVSVHQPAEGGPGHGTDSSPTTPSGRPRRSDRQGGGLRRDHARTIRADMENGNDVPR